MWNHIFVKGQSGVPGPRGATGDPGEQGRLGRGALLMLEVEGSRSGFSLDGH